MPDASPKWCPCSAPYARPPVTRQGSLTRVPVIKSFFNMVCAVISVLRPPATESRVVLGDLCVEDFVDGFERGLQPFFAMFVTIFVASGVILGFCSGHADKAGKAFKRHQSPPRFRLLRRLSASLRHASTVACSSPSKRLLW